MRWRDRAQLSYFPTVAGPELAGCVSGLRVAIPRQEFPPTTKPTSSRDGARSKDMQVRNLEIRDAAVRWKRKARHALSAKPVPDPLPRGALIVKAPGHDRKWTSAPW